MGARRPVHQRPRGPGGRLGPVCRRPRQDLQLGHRPRPLPVGGAQAVGAGVAAADDDHVPAGRRDRRLGQVALLHPVGRDEVVHGRIDAGQLAAGHRQVPRHRRAAGEQHRVVRRAQLVAADVAADLVGRQEPGALGPHLLNPLVQHPLLHLELGDAVAQQAADAVVALEHGDVVPGPSELLGRRQAGGTATHDGHRPAGALGRQLRRRPALRPGPVGNLNLHLLDRHRVGVDAQHAGCLARRGTQPAGELREVVRRVQSLGRLPPIVPVDQVVPLRDEVAQRTAVVAEGNPAVHAPGGLSPGVVGREVLVDLTPVLDPDLDRPASRQLSGVLEKACLVSHEPPP